MGHAHIRAREYQIQNHWEIDVPQEPDYVSSMRQEFSHSLEPYIEFEPDEVIEQRVHTVPHGIAKADGQKKSEATEGEEFYDSSDEPPA
jgi:hypothetical protein